MNEKVKDFYEKVVRVNVALQSTLFLLDDLEDNYLYKGRVKQVCNQFKANVEKELLRMTETFEKKETDLYSEIAHKFYEDLKGLILIVDESE